MCNLNEEFSFMSNFAAEREKEAAWKTIFDRVYTRETREIFTIWIFFNIVILCLVSW